MTTTRPAPLVEPPAEARAAAAHVPHRWRNLSTMLGITVIEGAEGGLTTSLFPAIAQALKLNTGHLGIMAALGRIVAVPFGPLWAWVANRTSRKTALVISTVLAGLLALLSGFSQDFVQLLVLQTIQAGCVVGILPISNAVIADSFPDKSRARAVGYFYGLGALLSSFIGPVLGQLSGIPDGWRIGLWVVGGILLLAGLLVLVLFREPRVGGAEEQLADLADTHSQPKLRLADSLALFRIPTFTIMMASRLLSGHLLIAVFGIQFLVTERGFSNPVATLVLLPFGIGYFAGTVGGGLLVTLLDRLLPRRGRVIYIQTAQVVFAVVAFFGTQFDYDNIGIYAVFWALMGAAQGLNPGVNRPIVMSVVLPELRSQAFVIYLTIFETIGWAIFTLLAGQLATTYGIQAVFFWVMVVLMLANAALLGLLHFCYPADRDRVTATLDQRRAEVLSER